MRESLVCIGKIGEYGYYFEDTGIRIFSYEELCYYMSQNMICYLHTLPGEDLLVYIRDELALPKLAKQLFKLMDPEKDQMKYFAALFREGNYFSEDEIREILDAYRSLKNAPDFLQNKWLGDLYVRRGRAVRAIACYEAAVKEPDLKEEDAGSIYHNMGIARAKLFRFEEAGISFLKAYQYGGDEKSLFYYYCIVALNEGLERAQEELHTFEASDILLESFQNEFAQMKEDFMADEIAGKFRKIVYMEENDRKDEALDAQHRLVRGLQQDFRKELEIS